MMTDTYGSKRYIAVEGIDKAMELAKAIMKSHDCQVLVQLDDADIYIVSWANRYGPYDGETFVFMNESQYSDYVDWRDSKEAQE